MSLSIYLGRHINIKLVLIFVKLKKRKKWLMRLGGFAVLLEEPPAAAQRFCLVCITVSSAASNSILKTEWKIQRQPDTCETQQQSQG